MAKIWREQSCVCGMSEGHEGECMVWGAGDFDTKPSVQTIPARWSITVGIDSIEWFTACWYRWYFSKEDGVKVSQTIDWNLRRFWKVNVEP